MSDAQQRYVMVTGGSQGIGLATVHKLAAQGCHIVIASRNQQTSARAIDQVRAATPGAQVEAIPLDLASFASVRQCADAYKSTGYPLHVLVNNAGGTIYGKQAHFSVDGFEMTLQTNHLGHFLLTHLLLDALKTSDQARVVNVSSQTHIPGFGFGPPPDFDWDNLKAEKYYSPAVFYKTVKLITMFFTYELQRRLEDTNITANAMCPGFVPQAIAGRRTGLKRFMYQQVLARMPFARSLEQAATSLAYTATSPALNGVGGKFIVDCRETRSSDESYDEQKARRMWDLSWQWCGLH
ncbi:MAG TPA: SDR family NAD(P)-dependent oxidoreductase [Anaerolineae bacterium]